MDALLENLRGICAFARQQDGQCRAAGVDRADYCTVCEAAERLEQALRLAREAANSWACVAKTKRDSAYIYELHERINALEGPAGGARGCNQENQGTPQSTGALSARLADCVAVLTAIAPPTDHPSVLLSRYRYQQCLDLLREAAFATGSMAALGQRQRTVRETITSLAKSGWLTEDEATGILATLPEPRELSI